MLSVGDRAPSFEGTDQNGNTVRLEDLLERSNVVLYFYPKDFTRVCTQQACLFRDVYADLDAKDATIVGVSLDSEGTHAKFSSRHDLPFSLVADRSKKIARAYDVLRIFGLFTKRVTYVIDREQTVRGVFHFETSAEKHLDAVEKLLDEMAAA